MTHPDYPSCPEVEAYWLRRDLDADLLPDEELVLPEGD